MGKGGDHPCNAGGLGSMIGELFQCNVCHPQYLERIQLPSQIKVHSFLQAWEKPEMHLGNRTIYDSPGSRKKA
jgi:hypothetical protein